MSSITSIAVKTFAAGFLAAGNLAYAAPSVEPIQEGEMPIVRRALCINNGLQIRNQDEVLSCRDFFAKKSSGVSNDDNLAIIDTVCYRRNRLSYETRSFNDCRDGLASRYNINVTGEGLIKAIQRANIILSGTESAGGNLLVAAASNNAPERIIIIQQPVPERKEESAGESCVKWAVAGLVAKFIIHGAALAADVAGCSGMCSAGASAITFGIGGTVVAGCAGGVGMNLVEKGVSGSGSQPRPRTP